MFQYSPARHPDEVGFGLATDRFLCVVGPLADPAELRALWELLSSETSHLEDVLSLFAARGIAKIPPFALVELVDVATGSVLLAVRGGCEVVISGRDLGPYGGAGATTWVEGAAQNVAGLSLGFAGARVDGELPLVRGVVRTENLVWRPFGEAAPEVARQDADAAGSGGSHDEIDMPADASVESADEPDELPDWAHPASAPTPDLDDDADRTVLGTRRRAPTADLDDDADHTMIASSNRRSGRASAFELRLRSGEVVDLSRPVLVGRKPTAPASPPTRLVTVPSPTNEVSGTHVGFSEGAGGVEIRDTQSTNGTVIRQPGKDHFSCGMVNR